jgi:hypothetical protein
MGALQNRTASMCQSGVSTQPLEERRAQNECYDIRIGRCKARVPDVLGRATDRGDREPTIWSGRVDQVSGAAAGRASGIRSMRQWALVGAQDQSARARGRAVACAVHSSVCADEQDRCGGRTGDLDRGASAGNAHSGSEDRRSAGDARGASHARIAGEVSHHAGEPATGVAVRVWRDVSGRAPRPGSRRSEHAWRSWRRRCRGC